MSKLGLDDPLKGRMLIDGSFHSLNLQTFGQDRPKPPITRSIMSEEKVIQFWNSMMMTEAASLGNLSF